MEELVHFDVNGKQVYGVLHLPADRRGDVGLCFLHGWSGTRSGPHDMLAKAARAYEQAGLPSLRFDFRGRGESEGGIFDHNLETMVEDTQVATQRLCELAAVERAVLVGICSGGEVAIGAGSICPEVCGMALWSVPMVAADRTAMRRRKQLDNIAEYGRKLFRLETWRKALTGRLNIGLIRRAVLGQGGAGETAAASDGDRAPPEPNIPWRERFLGFDGPLLFVYGTNDPTTPDSIAHYERLRDEAGITADYHLVEGANHSYYSLPWEREVIDVTLEWVKRAVAVAAGVSA